jgi:methionyl-tRNA formyltransferase
MGKLIKVFHTRMVERQSTQAGIVLNRTQNILEVGTGSGVVSLLEIQQEGKRRLGIEEFLRGYPIESGEMFM